VPERASTPLVEAAFQFIDTESENKAKFRKPRLHLVATGAFKEQLGVSIFQFYESEIRFVPAYPLDKSPMTFPGWLRLAETRSVSRPGKARRYAVKSLDTDLHRLGT
jgi:hypothetical protein